MFNTQKKVTSQVLADGKNLFHSEQYTYQEALEYLSKIGFQVMIDFDATSKKYFAKIYQSEPSGDWFKMAETESFPTQQLCLDSAFVIIAKS
jgi:hypothetical protein